MWVQEPRRSAGTGSLEECWSRDREEGGGSRDIVGVLVQELARSGGPGT